MDTNLTTPEQFLILAHRPVKGGFTHSGRAGNYIQYAVVGAVLLDLSVHNAIGLKDKILQVTGNRPDLYPLANTILEKIRQTDRDKKVKHWVRKLGSRGSRYKKEALMQLERKGKIRTEKKKFLGLIHYRRTYLTDRSHRIKQVQRLRDILLSRKEPEPDEAILLGLIEACKIHRVLTHQKEGRRTIKKALKRFNRENVIAGAVGETLQEIRAAVVAGISASAAASTAATSS